MIGSEIISNNGNLFLVNRKLRIDNNPILSNWKEITNSDIVFKKDGYYYLCSKIDDIEFEEITNIDLKEIKDGG